jgi:hypothetical protein
VSLGGLIYCAQGVAANADPGETNVQAAIPGTATSPKVKFETRRGVNFHSESLPLAPTTFSVSGDSIYLDDPVNDVITKYSKGKQIWDIPVAGIGAIDFQVGKEKLIILGENNRIFSTNEHPVRGKKSKPFYEFTVQVGNSLTRATSADVASPMIGASKLVSSDGVNKVLLEDGTQVLLSRMAKSVIDGKSEAFDIIDNGFVVMDSDGSVVKTIMVPNEPMGIEEIYRGDGYVYYLASDGLFDETTGAWTYTKYVVKYAAQGVQIATYTLQNAEYFTPNREVVVDRGKVYQLLIAEERVQVLELRPDAPPTAEQRAKAMKPKVDAVATAMIEPRYVPGNAAIKSIQ